MNTGVETIIEKVRTSLKPLDIFKALIFGSFANDAIQPESDLDLLVVLNKKTVSQDYQERLANKLLVRNALSEINQEIPIDLLVYTKAEFEILDNNRNAFFNEILTKGKILFTNSISEQEIP